MSVVDVSTLSLLQQPGLEADETSLELVVCKLKPVACHFVPAGEGLVIF